MSEQVKESPIEQMFWKQAHQAIPGLIRQYPVQTYRIDFALPEKKVAIELDGHEYHKTQEQRTYDAQRERTLQELGWQVIRFTGTEIYRDVSACIEQVKRICNM
jgi:very-short-patch-repair endonuclease